MKRGIHWETRRQQSQLPITKSVAARTIGPFSQFFKKSDIYFSEINRALNHTPGFTPSRLQNFYQLSVDFRENGDSNYHASHCFLLINLVTNRGAVVPRTENAGNNRLLARTPQTSWAFTFWCLILLRIIVELIRSGS